MKSKTTVLWFFIAVALAAAIWVLDNVFQSAAPAAKPILAGLQPGRITAVQIVPGGEREISVIRTNNAWVLQTPFVYPAQTAAIEGLLSALQKLVPATTFSAGEMTEHKNADAEFGFDNPLYTIDVSAGDQAWHLRIGNKTAPGDGVYVRLVGATGAFVTATSWLQFLPHDANDWRDTTLAEVPPGLDWLVITNGTQAIELRRNTTNHLWRMVRPLQARADNFRIVTALQQLRTAKVSRFVSDNPKADLAGYGLEPAALDVWLGVGTNLITAIHSGKEVTGMPGEVFARREGWDAIVTTPKDALVPWRGAVNDFRDPNLIELTAPVAEIEIRGDNGFTLQQRGSNTWAMAGQKFAVDPAQVQTLLRALTSLKIADFVQDAVTASGLQSYGLATPTRQVTLRSAVGDTNSTIVQVQFGATTTNEVYVKRSDEDYVYGVALGGLGELALPPDYYRNHQVWSFSETNVADVVIKQNGHTRQLTRNGTNDWSLAAGSQGIITPAEVEEAVHRLGDLSVLAWIGRKFNDADIGLNPTNGLSLTVELKTGEKYSVDFGRFVDLPSLKTAGRLAVVTLDGERWAFIFPPVLYPLLEESFGLSKESP